MEKIKEKGFGCEIIDTSNMSDEEIFRLYEKAWIPSVRKKYKIRTVFGSNRNPGFNFGKDVPALLVYEEEKDYPTDVYPHISYGKLIEIEEFLKNKIETS